jgi:hypothetical protein
LCGSSYGRFDYAGINIREDPSNDPNYIVMFMDMRGRAAPELSINHVPIPSTFFLFFSGMKGFIGLRKKLKE